MGSTSARTVRQAGTHTVRLALDYDGLEPPVALMRDLAQAGWRPPAPASPPHDAIDWSRPDRARGLDHTIRPWRVVGAIVHPPPGSGPRGAWTEQEARERLAALDEVLARHGLAVDGRAAPPAARASAPSSTEDVVSPDGGRAAVLVSFVVEAPAAPAVRAALEADRLTHRSAPATIAVAQRYRGRDFTTDVAAVRFEVATTADRVDALAHDLGAVGVDRTLARLTIEPLEPAAPDPGMADVHPLAPRRGVA